MSNIVCAILNGLPGCANIYVIVLHNAVFLGGRDIDCYPLNKFITLSLQLCLQHSLAFHEKIQ